MVPSHNLAPKRTRAVIMPSIANMGNVTVVIACCRKVTDSPSVGLSSMKMINVVVSKRRALVRLVRKPSMAMASAARPMDRHFDSAWPAIADNVIPSRRRAGMTTQDRGSILRNVSHDSVQDHPNANAKHEA